MSRAHSYVDKEIMFEIDNKKQQQVLRKLGYVLRFREFGKGVAVMDGEAGYLVDEIANFEDELRAFVKDSGTDPKKVIASFQCDDYLTTYGYKIFVSQGKFAFEETEVKWVHCGMLYPFDPFEENGDSNEL